jgi:hypothetical protein
MEYWNNVLLGFSEILCKIPPSLPLPKGGDRVSPFEKGELRGISR